ncbi:signal peptidase II [Adlercreutzia caecimuris]|jgi:signal peptidase II|uniref:signal peptidase II n=1 Tax=Adlercreutzia caecimuris TaxID=671266 RepID=UPI000EE50E07|nr:signal peptidase II [Adlercreutzia caecimuris]MCI9208794.1 signal peptidase II [Adlercreutzia caecimuris]
MRRRNLCVFAAVVLLWLAADIATKAVCNGYGLGEVIAGPFLGLVQFRLAHNTGAAWGMFGDSTFALGVMSLLVCAALAAYLIATARRANLVEVVGIALVVAGGLGNALDRFTLGYVVDFIDTTFIEFPTFNVADIGVTCGFVLFFAGMLWGMRRDGLTTACADAGQPGAADAADEAAGPSGDVPRTGDACGPQGR